MAGEKGLTAEELRTHIKDICGTVVAEIVGEQMSKMNQRITAYGTLLEGGKSGTAIVAATEKQKGLAVGAIIGALAAAKGDHDRAIALLKRDEKNKANNEPIIKALEASTATAGGVLIPDQVSSDFIDLLTPRAAVRSFGTTVVPMDSGGMTVPKLTSASTAYYIGEGVDPTISQQTFGMKKLTARKLAVLVPISNDLLRRGGPRVAAIVRNDALRSAALKEDAAFIRNQGTQFSPKGLRYQAAAANVLAATGSTSYSLDTVTADLGNLILALEEANVAFSNPGWILAPRTAMYLMTVRNANGYFAFRDEMMTGKLWGFPFKKTTQIPRNLGSGSDSEVYLADFDDVVIGDTMAVEVAVSTEASYKDDNGDLQSTFSLDQTVMRVLLEHDLTVRHDESVGVLTGVLWTPGGGV